MKQTERHEDYEEAIRQAQDELQSSIWTALPCTVDSFDPATQTCALTPTIQGKLYAKDGTSTDVNMPQLVNVPVYRLRGGGFSCTVPIVEGDEGVAIFSSRCIDAWWQNGGIQPQFEQRMHDLSDGFFLPGFNSQTKNLTAYCTTGVQLRDDAGDVTVTVTATEIDALVKTNTYVKIKDKEIDMKAGGSTITMTDTELDIVATTLKFNGIVWDTHEHTGVQAGGSKTGGPTGP